MCYLVRQPATEAELGAVPPTPGSDRVRTRWAGVAAATVVAGLALAALVAPSPTAPLTQPPQSAAPMAARTGSVPVEPASAFERTSLPADDGVPTSTPDVARAGIGPCHHGL